MTTEQDRNRALAERYLELYNSDVERFVTECYTEDCVIVFGAFGFTGHERFHKVERRVLAAAPNRRMERASILVAGDKAVVEAVLVDPDRGADWELPFCAVLTCRDGRIAEDHTYADPAAWPS